MTDKPATLQPAPGAIDSVLPPPSWGAQPLASSTWAQVQARYVMAQARPRVWAQVRYELLYECQNPHFAEKAIYDLQIGRESVRGLSVRFAEAAARAMQNLWIEVQSGPETDNERSLIVSVTDLQANTGYSQQISVEKFVLRHFPPRGEQPFVHSHNRKGQPLYRHPASEQDMLAKGNAAVSKARRNLILTHLPHWLQAECKVELVRTQQAQGNRARGHLPRDVLNGFADLGISALQVQEYLGHDVMQAQPAELESLRSLALAIQEEAVTWAQALEARRSGEPAPPPAAAPGPEPSEHAPSEPPPPPPSSPPPRRPDPPTPTAAPSPQPTPQSPPTGPGSRRPPGPQPSEPPSQGPGQPAGRGATLAAQLRRSRAPYRSPSIQPAQD